ncbi:MAG: hypothetical protein ACYTGX_19130 [Planctomycetota bacterium]|jgi:hypothetical protein
MDRRLLSTLLAGSALALISPASAGAPQVEWKHEGLSKLPAALARAKQSGKRLLVGLSGGPG